MVRYTGWPPFRIPTAPALAPVCDEDGVACWLGNPDANRLFTDAGLSDYWRASTDGRLYLQSGYQEDGSGTLQPGRVFDVILPIWRAGELLAHAAGFARAMGAAEDAGINLRLRYTGLEGRDLVSWAKPADRGLVVGVHRSRLPEAHLAVRATPARIAEDLPGLVHQLLAPLYGRFDGYVLDRALVEREVQEMEGRKRP
ncbi:hypothetical protein DEW08_00520 [Azospirillum thermophilum]|uniref:Uncharacterized protein n=1 Tax=Azospirillum thermophilum TaxID=2202148 RepID=A0A2S2CK51_9PROT|nr:hypothetical protein DEW08_00520 [Azospirillum thermophilum]